MQWATRKASKSFEVNHPSIVGRKGKLEFDMELQDEYDRIYEIYLSWYYRVIVNVSNIFLCDTILGMTVKEQITKIATSLEDEIEEVEVDKWLPIGDRLSNSDILDNVFEICEVILRNVEIEW